MDISSNAAPLYPLAAGQPATYVRSDGVNAVVFRGYDQHIYEARIEPGWINWQSADLFAISGPPIGAKGDPFGYRRSDGVNSVLYHGNDNKIYELFLLPADHWRVSPLTDTAKSPRPGVQASAPLSGGDPLGNATSLGYNSVIYVGIDHHIYGHVGCPNFKHNLLLIRRFIRQYFVLDPPSCSFLRAGLP